MANIIRRDPVREMLSWNRAMERLMQDFYGDSELSYTDSMNFRMPLDVIENDDAFVIKADIAGIDPEEIEITYTNNNLTIKGQVSDEREEMEAEGRYHLRERRYGTFSRTISLPGDVQAADIEAVSQNGVLELHLPKKEEVKPKRISVKVNTGKNVIEGKSKDK